jgi:hypothetical protein
MKYGQQTQPEFQLDSVNSQTGNRAAGCPSGQTSAGRIEVVCRRGKDGWPCGTSNWKVWKEGKTEEKLRNRRRTETVQGEVSAQEVKAAPRRGLAVEGTTGWLVDGVKLCCRRQFFD